MCLLAWDHDGWFLKCDSSVRLRLSGEKKIWLPSPDGKKYQINVTTFRSDSLIMATTLLYTPTLIINHTLQNYIIGSPQVFPLQRCNQTALHQDKTAIICTYTVMYAGVYCSYVLTSRTRWIILSVSMIWNIWQTCWWWSLRRASISRYTRGRSFCIIIQ